jgi:hypothetical protein
LDIILSSYSIRSFSEWSLGIKRCLKNYVKDIKSMIELKGLKILRHDYCYSKWNSKNENAMIIYKKHKIDSDSHKNQ